ncbi:transcription/translation regulatory transformer protein RfaH [Stutzerimonas stutzeri]|uniref:Transcription/translation regulatory transformer protein RfaH n=1 Tax=Stutzerimonas stutzeri TaxID=316 RepID=A0A6I6M091_STUST|nr:transcription/translation regulatory transformer protein RfaH [Stutzerimonas stutzeri]
MFRALGEAVDRHTEWPKAWYLVQCKSRQDGRAQAHLARQGFECFAPIVKVQTMGGGRLRELQEPLFPGYLFIRMGENDNWLSLRSTRGVSRVVAFCGQPCRVQDAIVEHLRQRCETTDVRAALMPGDRVQVKVGARADIEAVFVAMDAEQRVMVLLNVLNRQQQVQIPLARIQPVQRRAVVPS